jgi:hypothetical protein
MHDLTDDDRARLGEIADGIEREVDLVVLHADWARDLAFLRKLAQQSSGDQGLREGVRELDEIAMAAWRARTALHLNLAELGQGLDATTTKNLADLINDLNEHMPLGEDGHTWRMRPEIRALLTDSTDDQQEGEG